MAAIFQLLAAQCLAAGVYVCSGRQLFTWLEYFGDSVQLCNPWRLGTCGAGTSIEEACALQQHMNLLCSVGVRECGCVMLYGYCAFATVLHSEDNLEQANGAFPLDALASVLQHQHCCSYRLRPVQSFLKNILDVADNLERAYGAVPPDALSEEEGKVGTFHAALWVLCLQESKPEGHQSRCMCARL
eukprot:1160959-Pelagomonas_calceolata.AAC.9